MFLDASTTGVDEISVLICLHAYKFARQIRRVGDMVHGSGVRGNLDLVDFPRAEQLLSLLVDDGSDHIGVALLLLLMETLDDIFERLIRLLRQLPRGVNDARRIDLLSITNDTTCGR